MLDLGAAIVGLAGYGLFIFTWLNVRPRGSISVLDLFVVLFSLQYGPHAFLPHPARELSLLVPEAYPAYAMGLGLAYLGLAAGVGLTGVIAGTNRLRWPQFTSDISPKGAAILCVVGLAYIFLFVAAEGFNVSRTLNYLKFFFGNSAFSYAELRRELYAESAITSIGSITRQTTSAILFAALVYAGLRHVGLRLVTFSVAALLFIFCSMQMNKFPFIYYALSAATIVFLARADVTRKFVSQRLIILCSVGVAAMMAFLFIMYQVQYAAGAAQGLVTNDRLAFRTLYRPFAANHDALQLWFAFFPDRVDFIGLRNVAPLVKPFGLNYFSAMTEIPALYTHTVTTFQAGFIGSSYASFGYPGIFICAFGVGALLAILCAQQYRFRLRWMTICYVAVVGMNMYFLSSRELHTALISGGVLTAPAIFWIVDAVMRRQRDARPLRAFPMSRLRSPAGQPAGAAPTARRSLTSPPRPL